MSIKRRPRVTAGAGRDLWQELLQRMTNPADRDAEFFMRWIIESVVIDSINVRMASDDAFAESIGERLQKFLAAEQSRRTPDLSA